VRTLTATGLVVAGCLLATAAGFGNAVINPDVPATWLVVDIGFAAAAFLVPGGALLAGGLFSNALVAQFCAGVPDFIPVAGRLLSPGDVAIVCGFAPILASLAYRYSKPVSDESFASDC
jgi:hypothetical protein